MSFTYKFADGEEDVRQAKEGKSVFSGLRASNFSSSFAIIQNETFTDEFYSEIEPYSLDFGPSKYIPPEDLKLRSEEYRDEVSLPYCGSVVENITVPPRLVDEAHEYTASKDTTLRINTRDLVFVDIYCPEYPILTTVEQINCSANYDSTALFYNGNFEGGRVRDLGTVFVTPNAGFTGLAQFTLRLENGNGLTEIMVTVNVI